MVAFVSRVCPDPPGRAGRSCAPFQEEATWEPGRASRLRLAAPDPPEPGTHSRRPDVGAATWDEQAPPPGWQWGLLPGGRGLAPGVPRPVA